MERWGVPKDQGILHTLPTHQLGASAPHEPNLCMIPANEPHGRLNPGPMACKKVHSALAPWSLEQGGSGLEVTSKQTIMAKPSIHDCMIGRQKPGQRRAAWKPQRTSLLGRQAWGLHFAVDTGSCLRMLTWSPVGAEHEAVCCRMNVSTRTLLLWQDWMLRSS